MKLSEAILMNGMMKPQGHGSNSFRSLDTPCALGGAAQSVGCVQEYYALEDVWPWITRDVYLPQEREFTSIKRAIWLLNDRYGWTRAQIAEWVATIEPQETPQPEVEIIDALTVLS